MSDITTRPKTKDHIKVERPRLHKVILVNDDYTPREFVVLLTLPAWLLLLMMRAPRKVIVGAAAE